MSEEEKNEETPETAEAAEEPEAQAAEEAPAEEPAAEETPAEEPAAAETAPAEEPAAEEPAPQSASPSADPGTPAGGAEDVAGSGSLHPKQLRKRERATHSGESRPPRTPEERISERAAARSKKAADRRRRRAKARQAHTPGTGTPPAEREPGTKKIRQGTVVSDKADKTITVKVEVVRRHPVYEKVIRRSATIHVHDERNEANAGDVVRVIESRPLSRTKRWRLAEILERAR